jgi:hypothetical protein
MSQPGEFMGRASSRDATATKDQVPTKLSDLPSQPRNAICSGGCGRAATHKFACTVRDPKQKNRAKTVVMRSWDVCESCATKLVFQIQKNLI